MPPIPKKLPDMPKGNWKAGLKFSPNTGTAKKETEVVKKVKTESSDTKAKFAKPTPKAKKPPKPLKRTPLKRPTKPINQIGERKKRRISEYGTESDFFVRIWEKRVARQDIWCEVCGEQVVSPVLCGKLIKPQCFAHKLAKGMYEKFRYLEENIGVVCTIKCHHAQDELLNDPEIRKNLEEEFDKILLLKNKSGQQQ